MPQIFSSSTAWTWRANLKFAGNQPLHSGEGSEEYFVVCRDGGRIAAYARVTRFYGLSMVMEYGYVAGAVGVDAMLATFKCLGEEASGAPVTSQRTGDHRRAALLRSASTPAAPSALVTHTAHDPALERALDGAGCPVAHHTDNFYMWRVLAPDKLAMRFAMAAQAASARAFEIFTDSRSLFWTADRFGPKNHPAAPGRSPQRELLATILLLFRCVGEVV